VENLDLKDRKILYHLDLDSRQSFRSLGKKVGLSKDVVTSRVKKLQEKGIIVRFNTLINFFKLGFTSIRFYFKFQYISPQIKKEIIDHFVNNKYVEIVAEVGGNHDLTVFMMTNNPIDIYSFWQKTLTKYRDYFADQIISIYVGEKFYSKSFLLDEKDNRFNHMIKRGGGVAKYDELDFKILQILSLNARTKIIEIANTLKTSTATINKRIKKLKESGVIDRFHITLNCDIIGYRWFKVDLYLREYEKIHELTKYVEQNPHLAYIDITIGYADLELEFIVKNQQELHEIINDLQSKFPKLIRKILYISVLKSHKWTNMIVE
jgi:DNA-binding Lrp family transcriptional regulator